MIRLYRLVAAALPVRPYGVRSILAVLFSALLLAVGCRRPAEPSRSALNAQPDQAAAILFNMRDAYRDAQGYSDQGVMRLSYREQGKPWVDEAPFAVRWKRPQRIRVRAYNTLVWCDGEQLVARIEDKLTSNLDGQVLVQPCPAELSLADLYRDPVLREAITAGLGRQPVQLEMLLGDSPLEAIFQPAVSKRLLASSDCDGHRCYRVEATTAEGPFVFWVDEQLFLLRRLEYPLRALLPDLAAADAEARLVADFVDATFAAPESDSLFRPEIPADATRVQAFVLPPQPLPTQLFGQVPARFAFVDPAGGRLTQEQLRGRVTVLAWFQDHPACRRYLEQLDQIRAQRSAAGDIAFYAVCTEPSTRSHAELLGLMKNWNVSVPLLRDLEACGRDVFHIPWAPTLVILDAQGLVQVFEVGANPYLKEQLPSVLDRLLAGDDLASEIVAAQQRSQVAYTQALASGGVGAEPEGVPATPVSARPPQTLRLESAWTVPFADAGNIVASDAAGEASPRIWVLRGRQTVCELDGDGQLIREFSLPATLSADYVRTELDGDQRRYFVASAIQGRSAVVIGPRGELVGRYPPESFPHEGIADAQLLDLDSDGTLELIVAFRGSAGVHCATLECEQKWVHHGLPDALSVAGTTPGTSGSRRLLMAGPRGDLLETDAGGQENRSHSVPGRAVFHVYTMQCPSPNAAPYCGITFDDTGQLVVLGLGSDLVEKWHYAMPAGTYRYPVQFVTSTLWDAPWQRAWVFAGSDGTIHFIGEEGQAIDQFATGHHIRGLAVVGHRNSRLLLVSSDEKVSAWTLVAGSSRP